MRHLRSPEVQQNIYHEAIITPAEVTHRDVDVTSSTGESQTLHFSVAEVPNPHAAIIVPSQWSSFGERGGKVIEDLTYVGEEQRIGTMAASSGARVIFLDFPGMGKADERGDELTSTQIMELGKGRMSDLAANYWQAIQNQELLTDADGNQLPVALWGHSLGSLTAAELAATTPEEIDIADAYFSEPMALRKKLAMMVAVNFMTAGARDDEIYNRMNAGAPAPTNEWDIGPLIRQIAVQRQSHLLSLRAMAQGQHSAILKEGIQNGRITPDTQIHLVAGEHGLADLGAMHELGNRLKSRGARTQVLKGESHGYEIALPSGLARMADLAIKKS